MEAIRPKEECSMPSPFAVVETGAKQYKMTPGQRVRVEKIEGQVGDSIQLDRIVAISLAEGSVVAGTPYVSGAAVKAKILAQDRDRKITVFKYKPKKRIRAKTGHRQPFTMLQIEELSLPGSEPAVVKTEAEKPEAEEAKVPAAEAEPEKKAARAKAKKTEEA
jgi:large subunit ribosomal protein L21